MEQSNTKNVNQISDEVNHPKHYEGANGIECIDAIRAAMGDEDFVAFCKGNAIKYLWRCEYKHTEDPTIDLQKAKWYIDKIIEYYQNLDNERMEY